jgi:transcriptional regulator with XRE-family HTH domain
VSKGIRVRNAAHLGHAIDELRLRQGLTTTQLASRIAEITGNKPRSAINLLSAWRTGLKRPTPAALQPVLQALGYDLALVPREDT